MWLGKVGAIKCSDVLKRKGKIKLGLNQESFDAHIEWAKRLEKLERVKKPRKDENGRLYFVIVLFGECTEYPVIRYYPTEEELDLLAKKPPREEMSFKERSDAYLKKLAIF